jgi:AsmA protein
VEGVDLWFEVDRAKTLLQKQAPANGQSSGHTKFDAFQASADITNGVAKTTDLNIASQNLRVTGQGTTNLVTTAIDYQIKATLYKEAPTAAASGDILLEVPLNVTGTTNKLNVRPDLEAMARSRAQQELDKNKGELRQKLMDKLKGILK